jgi:hypothetical protein
MDILFVVDPIHPAAAAHRSFYIYREWRVLLCAGPTWSAYIIIFKKI